MLSRVEDTSGVTAVEFRQLLLRADEPLLLMVLGCVFHHGPPMELVQNRGSGGNSGWRE
jgi:hypothetical protein